MPAHFPPYWRERLLAVVGAPHTPENFRLLDAWACAEGGMARWNPLNTKRDETGATNYNSDGVKNYLRPTEGVCAMARTLVNGHYPGILGALQGGRLSAEEIVQRHRAEFSVWGTIPDAILRCLAA